MPKRIPPTINVPAKIWANPIRVERTIRITDRIGRAEKAYVKAHNLQTMGPRQRKFFYTDAPRRAIYGATHEVTFSLSLEHLEPLADRDLADLGSGFGSICFVAGLYFRSVTGFELDRNLFEQAEGLKPELNFEGNVNFRHQDFLEADLSGFGALFVFEPFWSGLDEALLDKFSELETGAIVFPLIRPGFRDNVMPASGWKHLLPTAVTRQEFALYEAFEKI